MEVTISLLLSAVNSPDSLALPQVKTKASATYPLLLPLGT